MTYCPCGHERLMHDSWGCKHRDGCGVSIIYLTPAPSVKTIVPGSQIDHEAAADAIERGNQLVIEADRREESHVKIMNERAWQEVVPPPSGLT